jgi:hypothetical protein
MSNLLLIDSRVKDIGYLCSCLTSNTEYYVFDYDLDTLQSLQDNIPNNYDNIGIVQHDITYNEIINTYKIRNDPPAAFIYDLSTNTNIDASGNSIPVEYIQIVYDVSDCLYLDPSGNSIDVSNIITTTTILKKWKLLNSMEGASLQSCEDSSWDEFYGFLNFLKTKTTNLDLLACYLWSDNDWVNAITYMNANYLNVRASSNNTGAGGDFILESHNYSLIDVYFNAEILNYQYAFANEYTLTQSTSGTLPICNENPIAASDNGVLLSVQWGSSSIYVSTNDGTTWYAAAGGGNGWWAAISSNGDYSITSGAYSSIYRNINSLHIINSTRVFNSVTTPGSGYTATMDATGKYALYAATSGIIYYSSNYGSTYSTIYNYGSGVTANVQISKDGKKIITSSWDSTTLRLYDLSAANYDVSGTWTSYTIPTSSRRFCMNYDGSIVYVSTASTIIKIKNIFSSPTVTNISTSSTPYIVVCSGNGKIVAYSYNNSTTIYVSLDEGVTFSTYSTSVGIRALGINTSGSKIYACNTSGSIFVKLTYNTSASPAITINNGYFTSPAQTTGSFTQFNSSTWSSISNWDISSNAQYLNIVNQSLAWGYPSIPSGVTQWLSNQFHMVNNGQSRISQNITFAYRGTYRLSYLSMFRPATTATDFLTIEAGIGDNYSGKVQLTNSAWSNPTYDFMISNPGTYPLRYDFRLGDITSPNIYYPFNTDFTNYGTNSNITGSTVGGAARSNTIYKVGTGSLNLVSSSNQGFNIGNFSTSSTGFTVACWFRTNDTAANRRVFNFGITSNDFVNWIYLNLNSGGNAIFVIHNNYNTAVLFTLGTNATFTTNSWIHVAFTVEVGSPLTTYKAYINGVNTFTSTNTVSLPIANYTYPYLGCVDGISTYTNIYIDDFRIYHRPISSDEVGYLYNYNFDGTSLDRSIYLTGININYLNDNSLSTQTTNAPGAPTLNTLTTGAGQIIVSFSAPASDGGIVITDYKYSLNGGAYISAGTTTSPFTITGLSANTSYAITLKATNSVGDSSASNSLSVTTLDYPGTPTLVSLTEGYEQITVSFSAPASDGGSAITTYKYSLNGGEYISASTTTSPFIITGLTKQVSYTITLKATTVVGDSQTASNSLSATPFGVPNKPTFTISLGSSSVNITSITASDGGQAITTYKYSTNGVDFISTGNTNIPFTISGLVPGDGYYISIKATNSAGDSPVSDSQYILAGESPYPPYIVYAQSTIDQSLNVYFNLPTYDGYNALTTLSYSLNGASYVNASSLNSPLTLTGLTNGQNYSIQLKVSNSIGTSNASNSVSESISTLPTSPTLNSITPSDTQLTVYYTPPAQDGSASILYFMYSLNGESDISTNSLSSPFTITNLTNGSSYSVKLLAVNRMGKSSYSNILTSTPYTIPSKPVITNISQQTKSLEVYFSFTNNGGNAINNISYSLNGASYINTNTTSSPFTINGLTEGTPYTIAIKTTNNAGDSLPSDSSYVYLSYHYNYEKPLSIESNGEVFVMTQRNELNGNTQYKYSYDGFNWTSQSLPISLLTTANPYNIKWNGNQFLMVGDINNGNTNTILKSSDGIDFSHTKTSSSYPIYDMETNVEYNNYIMFPKDVTLVFGGDVSDNTKIAISYDSGNTWASSSNSHTIFTKKANDGVWNGKLWVAVGEGNTPIYDASTQTWIQQIQDGHTIATSIDGNTWIGRGKTLFSSAGNAIDWNKTQNLFVSVGDGSGNSIGYSYDGVYWQGCGKPIFESGNFVKTNGKIWVAGGTIRSNSGQKTLGYSYDGKTWLIPAQNNLFQISADSISWNGVYWKVYGTDASYNTATSMDGIIWDMKYTNTLSPQIYNNNNYYFKITNNQLAQSPDNVYWSNSVSIPNMSILKSLSWNRSNEGVPYIQPLTVAVGDGDNTIAYSYDGIYWNGLGKNIFSIRGNKAVWNGAFWLAVGSGTCWCAKSFDGISWEAIHDNKFTEAYDVAWNGFVFVAVGEGSTRIAISVNGIEWSHIHNSEYLFTIRATSITWTGKVWLAYGSGANTTAISNDIYAFNWSPTTTTNLCITDMSSAIQYAYGIYPQNINSDYLYANWNLSGYEPTKMVDGSLNTFYKTNNAFSSVDGTSQNGYTFTYNNSQSSHTGHAIVFDMSQQVIIKSYSICYQVDASQNNLREWALIGIPGDNTIANLFVSPYNGDLIHHVNLDAPPETQYYVRYNNIQNNTQYRIYVLLAIRSYASDIRINDFNMYYENPITTVISKYIKPIVTQEYILHPQTLISPYGVPYLLTDCCCNLLNSMSYPCRVVSNYGVSIGNYNKTISCYLKDISSNITSYGFDGEHIYYTTIYGDFRFLTNNQLYSDYVFDNSFNGANINTNLQNIYTSCYNKSYIILGGGGGSVITYHSLQNGISPSWFSTNANNLFNNVYGLASNSGYGHVYLPNMLYFSPGDKLSVVTPKTNNHLFQTNTSINIDLISHA